MIYTFSEKGQCVVYQKKTFSRYAGITYDAVLQADSLTGGTTYTNYSNYIPKTKPIPAANAVNITNVSAENPIVITTAANHGLVTGDYSAIASIIGDIGTVLNGLNHLVTRIDARNFSIEINGTGLTYTSGGTSTRTSIYKNIAPSTPAIEQQFSTTYVDSSANPPDRQIQFLAPSSKVRTIGIAMGYVTDRQLGSKANRAVNNNRWWYIPASAKCYPYHISKTTAVPIGDEKECTMYRVISNVLEVPDTTSFYFIELSDCYHVFVDFHQTATNKEIELPRMMRFKTITVLDSETCAIAETTVPANGEIHLTTTGSYGFITLKIEK
jgi:hypothetical protein